VLAHGTLPDPDRFEYIQSTSEADPSLVRRSWPGSMPERP